MDNSQKRRYMVTGVMVGIVILLAALVYVNALSGSFIYDDLGLIVENRFIRDPVNIPYFFSLQYWGEHHPGGNTYRPVRTVSFAMDYALWGGAKPRGFHFTNLVLHVINCLLVFFLMKALIGHYLINHYPPRGQTAQQDDSPWLPFMTAVLFAVHPVHTEAVVWIKNRSELIVFACYLLSFFFFLKHSFLKHSEASRSVHRWGIYGLSLFFFGVGLLTKETIFSLAPVLIAFVLLFHSRERRWGLVLGTLPCFALSFLYLVIKRSGLGTVSMYEETFLTGFSQRALAVIETVGRYLALLIWPVNLTIEHDFRVPVSFFEPPVLVTVACMAVLAALMWITARRARLLSFALAWLAVGLIPVSNIVFIGGRPLAEQRLYLPSLGFCCALSWGIIALYEAGSRLISRKRMKTCAVATFLIITATYAGMTVRRNVDWKDQYTIFSRALQVAPAVAKTHMHLGHIHALRGETLRAVSCYEQAIKLDPYRVEPYYNLGTLYSRQGNLKQAETLYETMIRLMAERPDGYFLKGMFFSNQGSYRQALPPLQKAVSIRADFAEAYLELGTVHERLGNHEQAEDAFNKAAKSNTRSAEVLYLAGCYHERRGIHTSALELFERSVTADSAFRPAYAGLIRVYTQQGNRPAIESWYRKARQAGIEDRELLNLLPAQQ